jgi:alpha-1,6-mannosyltransferase
VRIVQVANVLPATTGSVELVIDALGAEYVASGHELMVIRPGRRHHLAHRGPDHVRLELPSVGVPMAGGHRLFVRRAPVAALISSWRPDVVEVHDTTTLTWAGPLAHRIGAAGVLCAHERISRRTRRAAAGFALTVVPHGVGLPHPAGGGPARVIPFGVDLEAFHPARRLAVDRPATPARVLLVGRLTRDHRPTSPRWRSRNCVGEASMPNCWRSATAPSAATWAVPWRACACSVTSTTASTSPPCSPTPTS